MKVRKEKSDTTTYCCERCGQEESELHQIAGKFVCPACSQTTAEADAMRVLFGVPKCAKGHGDCHPNCEYGLAGPCVPITEAGACAICDEPLQRDEVFISTLDGNWFCSLPCRNRYWESNREERMKDV